MGIQYRIPLGYRLCDGIIVPDEKMGPVIQMIFHDYAKGSFIGHICVRLEPLGLENSRGNVKWQERKIRDILKEEAYCGNSIYPALISRELYDQVQEQCIIRNNHKRYETDEDVKEKICSFILKCSDVRIADLYISEFREEGCSVQMEVSIQMRTGFALAVKLNGRRRAKYMYGLPMNR